MPAYRLRPADLTNVRKEAEMYKEHPTGYRQWMPIETIPRSITSKWYSLARVVTPVLSMDGSDYVGVRTARTEDSAPVIWMRYKFHWDITEVEAAQKAGVPLKSDDARVALKQIDNKIAQLIINGLDYPDTINGLTEDGTDLGGGLDTTYVGVADDFIDHAIVGYNHLLTNGYRGPYHFIVSDTISQFLYIPVTGSHGITQWDYLEDNLSKQLRLPNGFKIFTERAIDAASLPVEETLEEEIYPMVYSADTGIWVMIAADPANMALQEVSQPTFTVNPEINRDTNKYEGYVEWQGTLRITHATAACYMEDVDHSA
jgi:uncharacterized linocin/CFP29 family protein